MHPSPAAPKDLAQLEAQLRAGDPDSLNALFERHRERLAKIVLFRMDQRLQGRLDPDDVLQEAYLAASKRLDQFGRDFDGAAFVWLRLIVRQTLVDLQRHHLGAKKRDAGREFVVRDSSTSKNITQHLFGQASSPSQAVMRQDMIDRVEQAIAAMDKNDREILAMRHFEELTNKETAQILKISEKNASIRYFRALKRLKEVLGQYSIFLSPYTG